LLLVSTALLTFALDDPAFQSSVQIRLRMHQNQLVIYTPKSKKILETLFLVGEGYPLPHTQPTSGAEIGHLWRLDLLPNFKLLPTPLRPQASHQLNPPLISHTPFLIDAFGDSLERSLYL